MVLENFLCTRPLFVFRGFLVFVLFLFLFWRGRIGHNVFVVYIWFIWGVGGGGGVRGAGLLEIKYLFYISIYLLRNFYTPNYFYFIYYNYYFAGGCGWIGGLDIQYLFYVNAY